MRPRLLPIQIQLKRSLRIRKTASQTRLIAHIADADQWVPEKRDQIADLVVLRSAE